MPKYLDENGLSHFWDKIKAKFADKSTEIITSITRSGTTFSAKNAAGTELFTFTQQDNTVEKTSTTPLMDGTAAVGNETKYAAGNHVHPTDTTRAPLASPAFTGTPTAPTATSGTNTTQIATTAFVQSAVGGITVVSPSSTSPKMDGTAAVGTETAYARGDHVHPTDTSRVPTSRTVNGHALSSNVTVTNLDLGQMYGTCSTAAATAAKTVTMSGYLLTTGGIVSIRFENDVPDSATLNINSKGAKAIYVGATHAVFSGSAREKLQNAPIKECIVTNTIPWAKEDLPSNVKQLSIAPLLGQAISRIHDDESVSSLFGFEKEMKV